MPDTDVALIPAFCTALRIASMVHGGITAAVVVVAELVVVVAVLVVVVVRFVPMELVVDESASSPPATTAPIAPPRSNAPTTYATNFRPGTSAIEIPSVTASHPRLPRDATTAPLTRPGTRARGAR